MAESLAESLPECDVTLAIPFRSKPIGDPATLPYRVVEFTSMNVVKHMFDHDIIISNDFPPLAMLAFPWRKLVLDYYTLFWIEWMEQSRDALVGNGRKRAAWMSGARRRIGAELLYADFITSANDRQKDYYVGAMIALGLIDPAKYDADPGLHHLMAPVPHGVRPDPLFEPDAPVLKGVYAGIKESDKLIIWNGGVLQWYDPVTLLRAVKKLEGHRDDVKLVFVGGAYPGLGSMGLGVRFLQAVQEAKDLDLYNRSVFFDVSWVPYEKMKAYMLEADLAVCTYFDNLETHFSFRTRFVDVFWAELPLVCTHGDVLADVVRDKELGIVVPQSDVEALAAAIEKLLDDRDYYNRVKANIRANNASMQWNVAFEPLIEFCRNPQSSALPKWKRAAMLPGAWAQWVGSRVVEIAMR